MAHNITVDSGSPEPILLSTVKSVTISVLGFRPRLSSLLKFIAALQYNVKDWIRREIVDDDPYDEETLQFQRMVENKKHSGPKSEVSELNASLERVSKVKINYF